MLRVGSIHLCGGDSAFDRLVREIFAGNSLKVYDLPVFFNLKRIVDVVLYEALRSFVLV